MGSDHVAMDDLQIGEAGARFEQQELRILQPQGLEYRAATTVHLSGFDMFWSFRRRNTSNEMAYID